MKDREFIVQGFPINRKISDAIQLFGDLEDIDAFFSLPSNQRFNLTHEPLSTINILPVSLLHSYTCIFRWFNLLVYHLSCKKFTWSLSTREIKDSMIHVRTIIENVTGLRIDQPDPKGGTTSTGGVARKGFSNDSNFIQCVISLVEIEFSGILSKLHTQLSVILRIITQTEESIQKNLAIYVQTHIYLFMIPFHGQASHPLYIKYSPIPKKS